MTDYAKLSYYQYQHYLRFKQRVEAMPKKLVCQECHGCGGSVEPVLDDGTGPWENCGWCLGIGYLTPWLRGMWLRCTHSHRNRMNKQQQSN